jgi:hypothetical protein
VRETFKITRFDVAMRYLKVAGLTPALNFSYTSIWLGYHGGYFFPFWPSLFKVYLLIYSVCWNEISLSLPGDDSILVLLNAVRAFVLYNL